MERVHPFPIIPHPPRKSSIKAHSGCIGGDGGTSVSTGKTLDILNRCGILKDKESTTAAWLNLRKL